MRKNFIFDTSTLINDPGSIERFKGNNVILPLTVLEELDKIKTRPDFGGANTRRVIRKIDNYFGGGNPTKGIDIPNDIKLYIDVANLKNEKFNTGAKDDSILACAAAYENATLVSKDIAMRLRAQSFGITTSDYNNDNIQDANDIYKGYREMDLGTEYVEGLTDNGLDDCSGTMFEELLPNECVQLMQNGKNYIYRKTAAGRLNPIRIPKDIWGISSKNREQAFAFDLLLDPSVHLVSLLGPAGTGKTICATAAALEQVIESKKYSNVQFYRPIVPMGRELGFIPGTLSEKLNPWMGAIKDAISFISGSDYEGFMYLHRNKISIEALSYIRGRSVNNTLMIIEEAQNSSKHEIKTIITRVGYNSKIVLLGDLSQIDENYLDATNNGLTYVTEAFKHSKLSGSVLLTKGERSELATEASRIL